MIRDGERGIVREERGRGENGENWKFQWKKNNFDGLVIVIKKF